MKSFWWPSRGGTPQRITFAERPVGQLPKANLKNPARNSGLLRQKRAVSCHRASPKRAECCALSSAGEAFLSGFDPAMVGEQLQAAGLLLLEDLNGDQAVARYDAPGLNGLRSAAAAHIAHARVAAPSPSQMSLSYTRKLVRCLVLGMTLAMCRASQRTVRFDAFH